MSPHPASENSGIWKLIFGRLDWSSLPLHEPIVVGTFVMVALGGAVVLGLITKYRLWGMLWRDWFTTVDHKRIGIMYMVLGLIMFLRGFADAIMMRLQQAMAFNGSEGYLNSHHYDQIFTAHGVIMIFFVAMPMITGIMNYIVPLQIGARDVSFPFLNNFSFWMTTAGAVIVMMSLFVGEFARTGWLAYPPLSGIAYSPGVGVERQAQLVAQVLPKVRDVRRIGSAALDLCAVAEGRVDAQYEHGLGPWDWAGGALIAREAGAVLVLPGKDAVSADGALISAAAPGIAEEFGHLLTDIGAMTPIPG